MSNSVLVTGGCGFIGTRLVQRLCESQYSVRVLDDLSRGSDTYLEGLNIELKIGDVRDPNIVEEALAGIDTVIHLAAYGSVVESVTDPGANFQQNVDGTFSVLDGARVAGVRKFILASTGGALIGDTEPPVNELSLPKPISPYGASKLCGEAYCHAFGKAYGMQTVALRFANVYGPYSAHKKGAITVFIKAVMAGEPMIIYGDGSASRDFLYVDDLCQGIERALTTELEAGSVYHLASGHEVRIGELAREIARIGGSPDHPIEYHDRRPAEVDRNFARYDRAREVLGFEPQWALQDGLRATWQWFRAQGEGILEIATSDS